LVYEACF